MISIAKQSLLLPARPQRLLCQLYCFQTRPSAARFPCRWRYPSKHHVHRPIRVSNYTTKSTARAQQQFCVYESIPEAENLENYKPGGFHPILIGDILHSRYRVVDKLGFGAWSTIWLCQDEQSKKYVAVKVGKGELNHQEADVIDCLNDASSASHVDHPGRAMIPSTEHRFFVNGPNGTHPCYVKAAAQCSIAMARWETYPDYFQPETARSLIAQLVLAVDYIHARGFVHGDIHTNNILLRLPASFDQLLSIEQIYEKYDPPNPSPIIRLDKKPLTSNAPHETTSPMWLGKKCPEYPPSEAQLLLTDFGESFSPSAENRYDSNSARAIRPPEVRFGPAKQPLSFSHDIWSLACTIWEIFTDNRLFEPFFASRDDITAEQVIVLGKLPPDLWEKWEARHEYFSETGEYISPNRKLSSVSWEDRFEKHIQSTWREHGVAGFGEEEKAAFLDMMRYMLSFQPEKRVTIQGVLNSEWMKKWALPEFEKPRSGTT